MSERNGFHYAVFTPDEVESGEAWHQGWGRRTGHVDAYPGAAGIEAIKEEGRRLNLAPGTYYVFGIRLRDHAAVFYRVEVEASSVKRRALIVRQTGADPVRIEGEVMA